ncbi:hypothetical protein ACH5RR_004620, partial [Cinchona calisaya]
MEELGSFCLITGILSDYCSLSVGPKLLEREDNGGSTSLSRLCRGSSFPFPGCSIARILCVDDWASLSLILLLEQQLLVSRIVVNCSTPSIRNLRSSLGNLFVEEVYEDNHRLCIGQLLTAFLPVFLCAQEVGALCFEKFGCGFASSSCRAIGFWLQEFGILELLSGQVHRPESGDLSTFPWWSGGVGSFSFLICSFGVQFWAFGSAYSENGGLSFCIDDLVEWVRFLTAVNLLKWEYSPHFKWVIWSCFWLFWPHLCAPARQIGSLMFSELLAIFASARGYSRRLHISIKILMSEVMMNDVSGNVYWNGCMYVWQNRLDIKIQEGARELMRVLCYKDAG